MLKMNFEIACNWQHNSHENRLKRILPTSQIVRILCSLK